MALMILVNRVLACPDLTLAQVATRFGVRPSYVSTVRVRLRELEERLAQRATTIMSRSVHQRQCTSNLRPVPLQLAILAEPQASSRLEAAQPRPHSTSWKPGRSSLA